MKQLAFRVAAIGGLCICGFATSLVAQLAYPQAAKGTVTDEYFGTSVPDPYRWMEDDRAADTKAWVEAENKVTQQWLAQVPFRESIRARLTTLLNYEKYSSPFFEGGYTYFYRNNGLQNQSVLYRQKGSGQPEAFLDPNTFSADGTTSLAGIKFSASSTYMAYKISEGGSDWQKAIVIKVSDKKIVEDTLKDIKFSELSWKGDEGFYYSSYEKPLAGSQLSGMTQYHKLMYHQIGTPQSMDRLVFGGAKMPRRYVRGTVSDDGRYLLITAANLTSGNELHVQDLNQPGLPVVTMASTDAQRNTFITNEGSSLYIYTNYGAPNYRVVVVDAANPAQANWKDLIPESQHALRVTAAGGKLFANYMKDALSLVMQYNLKGVKEKEIALPGPGTASGFNGKPEDKEVFYSFTSYIYPPVIFRYDIATGKSEVFRKAGVQFDPTQYESKQVFYNSKDGTRIPMIITYKKGLVMNGKNPTLMYAYGGFGASETPSFTVANIVLLEQGGIYAVPNLRGGGEYGEEWHKAGTKLRKQNVFDDYIAAAEYLIRNKYTSSAYLGVSGESNGGLLVGAVMTQRPELYKVAFPGVGVMDMLRYNKFTAGAGWAYDYGTAEDSKEMFEYLYRYAPYYALKPGTTYPATMVTTADHDDRVVPAHSFKFAARLQEYQAGKLPTLIRIETKAGHNVGRSTAQVIAEETDRWSFFFYNMGITPKEIK